MKWFGNGGLLKSIYPKHSVLSSGAGDLPKHATGQEAGEAGDPLVGTAPRAHRPCPLRIVDLAVGGEEGVGALVHAQHLLIPSLTMS